MQVWSFKVQETKTSNKIALTLVCRGKIYVNEEFADFCGFSYNYGIVIQGLVIPQWMPGRFSKR